MRATFRILLAMALTSGSAGTLAQAQQGVLAPEDANEARLNRLQPPDQVMDAIGVRPGMAVAEIGAGRGRYVVQLAVRVGRAGRVYAEDIDRAALQHCAERSRRWGLDQVETVLGDTVHPGLPAGRLDLILVISSYHHFSDPITLLRNARPALKPEGILAIVEWLPRDDRDTDYGTPAQLEVQLRAAGFEPVRTDPRLRANRLMIYIFRPDSAGRSASVSPRIPG